MARELRRLLIPPHRLAAADAAEGVVLEPAERHYLRRVLRCRDGAEVAVADGGGRLWTARLQPDERLRLEQPLGLPLHYEPPAAVPITLAMAVPRRDADLVWRMATELGADGLQPLLAERSVVSGSLPLQRWATIVAEAAEQCERLWLPSLAEPQAALAWLSRPPSGVGLLATTRRDGLPLPMQRLATTAADSPGLPGQVTLAIGPEGGWTRAEEERALAAGWLAVSLAGPILRTATAAVAGVAQLCCWRQLSCSADRPQSPGSPPDRLRDGDAAGAGPPPG